MRAPRAIVKTKTLSPLSPLVPLVLLLGLAACGSQQAPATREAAVPAQPEAFVAPPAGAQVGTPTPVTSQLRTSIATPAPARRNVAPVVEASGPLSEPQRVVLSAVAICMQRSADKGNKLHDRSIIVDVTVNPAGEVTNVAMDGANEKLRSCAEPEIRKVLYPKTDDSAGMRVMQYPMDATVQAADKPVD